MNAKPILILTIILTLIVVYFICFHSSKPQQWQKQASAESTSKLITKDTPGTTYFQPSQQTENQQQMSIEEFRQQGKLSFISANRVNLQSKYQRLFQLREVALQLEQHDWADLYINSLSQLEMPHSHIFINIVEKLCDRVSEADRAILLNNHQSARSQLRALSVSAHKNAFYEAYLTQENLTRNRLINDCDTVKNLAENNREAIENSALNHYGTKNLEEFFMKFYDRNAAMEALVKITGFNRDIVFSENYIIENKIRYGNKKDHPLLAKEIIDKTQENPAFYLDNDFCGWSNFNCKKLMGKEAYQEFYQNGAFLGTRSTLKKYVSILENQDRGLEAIAWLKYQKSLNFYGCEGFNVIDNDRHLERLIKSKQRSLSAAQVKQIETIYHTYKARYLIRAREIINC